MAEGCGPLKNNNHSTCKTLYELSLSAVAYQFHTHKKHLAELPDKLLFDLYYQLYKEKKLCLLGVEFSNLYTFSRILKISERRVDLLKSFQALIDHGTKVANELSISYNMNSLKIKDKSSVREEVINVGLRLGGFLSDVGCYQESINILLACKEICRHGPQTFENWCYLLDCCHKLLHAQSAYCSFTGASDTLELAIQIMDKLEKNGYVNINHAALFAEFSLLYFSKSEYHEAYEWSRAALKQLELQQNLPASVVVNVLRQAAKSCVVKRKYQKAGLLIKQAVYLARDIYNTNHPKFSDVLLDYGFYLMNSDNIVSSVAVYETALEIRKSIFAKANLHVAAAHEDLAYALYVKEYSSGKFEAASLHADKAIEIMEKLLPTEHLMLASGKRVKALILEEIALDNAPMPSNEFNLFSKAETLHLSALQLSKSAFGERNVQTAKHYGNLGRLYQSMRRFLEAEDMHLKAIEIKEDLLGPEDYEVGLSIGHLASLYNFHMNRFRDAEELYYRSIAISLKLFGTTYSGLEYDYRGLLHIYSKLNENDKYSQFVDALNRWKELRDKGAIIEPPIPEEKCPQPIKNVISDFFADE